MKKNLLKTALGILLLSGISFFSCEDPQFNPDTSTAQDNARAEGSIIDVFGLVSSNADGGGKSLKADSACYDIDFTLDSVSGVRNLVITFDTAGCTINDIIYKGKISSVIHGNWFEVGSTLTTTFENFERDGIKIGGTITATYDSLAGTGLDKTPIHTITSTDMVQTYTDGKTVTWSGTTEIQWLSGYFTRRDRSDDKLLISGNTTGTNRSGEAYASISTDLLKEPLCKLFVSGTVTITKGIDVLTINFGNGDCDGEFTVTQNNVTVTVTP